MSITMGRSRVDESCLRVSMYEDKRHTPSMEMDIAELRVRPMSNFATPHELLGRGGARMALTSKELLQVVAEYLRYSVEACSHEQSDVSFCFSCTKKLS